QCAQVTLPSGGSPASSVTASMMLRGLRLGTGFGGSGFAGVPVLTASAIGSAGSSGRVHSKSWRCAGIGRLVLADDVHRRATLAQLTTQVGEVRIAGHQAEGVRGVVEQGFQRSRASAMSEVFLPLA